MKKVFKYGTGQEIPEGAEYLSTQVETVTQYEYGEDGEGVAYKRTFNKLVWHYFSVEVPEALSSVGGTDE